MKKLSLISVAALMLASCSSDEMSAPAGAGTEQEVSLSFQLPSEVMSRATQNGTDSSKGGATNCTGEVTFTVELSYNGKVIFSESADASIPNANASVTFRPTLVLGETYNIVAYAQFDDDQKVALTAITENGGINDENVDSYFHSGTIVAEPQMSATLYRPTGKLRIIADDYAAMNAQTGKTIEKVKVNYVQSQSTVFNAATGEWAAAGENKSFEAAWQTYSSEGDEKTIMVDYIPATATGEIINIASVEVYFAGEATPFVKNLSTLDVPIKRNYLTTLKGNFFTQEMELTLQIDDAFETPEEVINYELAAAFENGGVVTLSEDVALDKLYTVAEGKTVVINLNGKSITSAPEGSIAFSIPATSKLVINGEGNVSTEKTLLYAAYGTLQINGGNHTAGLEVAEANGKNGEGVVEINGGHFVVEPYNGNCWTLNKKDRTGAEIIVKGGSFVGFDPDDNVMENPKESFVAEGYKSVELEVGVWTVVKEETIVAVSDDQLEAALTADAENISVVLNGDLTYEVAAWAKDAMGGANTKTITIDGNGHTLTFNQTNSDWNNIVTNGATLIIKNAKLTNAGHNNGPWNRHDLVFNCDVELTDVVSDKALALKDDAKLTNVTINDANQSSTYAIWITTEGQNVTLEGCDIDMTACSDGRGIKIDEQYITANPSLVTLNVSNTTFKTAKKAAVIVKSKAGAVINWGEGNDISGVVADSQNAVWVDEASKAYYDLVVVNGATKAQE